jgi:hypothetical protein
MKLKVGDIIKVRYLPGSRYIIREIGIMFILLEGTDTLFWESEISLHEDQIKLNNRIKNLEELL